MATCVIMESASVFIIKILPKMVKSRCFHEAKIFSIFMIFSFQFFHYKPYHFALREYLEISLFDLQI